jgi:hydroxyacylglutathione hydrolase
LPPDTLVYSGHEYTISNLKFAQSIEPDNPRLISRGKQIAAARSAGRPTVPELLSEELATNPFLRADTAEVRKAVALEDAKDWEVFAEIRSRKDHF